MSMCRSRRGPLKHRKELDYPDIKINKFFPIIPNGLHMLEFGTLSVKHQLENRCDFCNVRFFQFELLLQLTLNVLKNILMRFDSTAPFLPPYHFNTPQRAWSHASLFTQLKYSGSCAFLRWTAEIPLGVWMAQLLRSLTDLERKIWRWNDDVSIFRKAPSERAEEFVRRTSGKFCERRCIGESQFCSLARREGHFWVASSTAFAKYMKRFYAIVFECLRYLRVVVWLISKAFFWQGH